MCIRDRGKAVLPKFAIGDFVLYARVRRQGVTPKLVSTWTGPWRVVGADHTLFLAKCTPPMSHVSVFMLTRI